uniref:Uncharacterized protein n=1 Tax=Ciona savignyi TaxID=51511 RepID=H2YQH7_CIOSA
MADLPKENGDILPTSEQVNGDAVPPSDNETINEESNNLPPDVTVEPTDVTSNEPAAEEGTTTTVQFIAVSADEHARMVSAGELPESVHGADVHMQIPGAEAQQVRLIAVDSNGVPVTESAILQAAAEQAGIVFIIKNDNGDDSQITIDQAMQLSMGENPPLITATTAAVVLEQKEKETNHDTDGNDTEDEGDGKKPPMKPRLKLRVYSQKDGPEDVTASFLDDGTLEDTPGVLEEEKPIDESVYEFQVGETGGDAEQPTESPMDPAILKKGVKRLADKSRDRRKIYQCRDCSFYSHRHSN